MHRQIEILDFKRFQEAAQFSRENCKLGKGLMDQISWLMTGEYREADRLVIGNDFVPNSFTFAFLKGDKLVINGAIICHGQGVETLSVELSPSKGVYFSIHT